MELTTEEFDKLVDSNLCPVCKQNVVLECVKSYRSGYIGIRCVECDYALIPMPQGTRNFIPCPKHFTPFLFIDNQISDEESHGATQWLTH